MAVPPSPALLTPLALRGVELRNRVVISPMQEYAAGALVGPEAYERYWQPRWGWWLVRRAVSLARREAGG